MIESRSRPTICDGEVVTFAASFDVREGLIGKLTEARGPFEVSASRNAVCVHRAELRSDEDVASFLEAIEEARKTAARLTREGWGGNYNYRVRRSSTTEPSL